MSCLHMVSFQPQVTFKYPNSAEDLGEIFLMNFQWWGLSQFAVMWVHCYLFLFPSNVKCLCWTTFCVEICFDQNLWKKSGNNHGSRAMRPRQQRSSSEKYHPAIQRESSLINVAADSKFQQDILVEKTLWLKVDPPLILFHSDSFKNNLFFFFFVE